MYATIRLDLQHKGCVSAIVGKETNGEKDCLPPPTNNPQVLVEVMDNWGNCTLKT